MFWSTLYNKIGKQPLRTTQRNQVYAILENSKHIRKKKYTCCSNIMIWDILILSRILRKRKKKV